MVLLFLQICSLGCPKPFRFLNSASSGKRASLRPKAIAESDSSRAIADIISGIYIKSGSLTFELRGLSIAALCFNICALVI